MRFSGVFGVYCYFLQNTRLCILPYLSANLHPGLGDPNSFVFVKKDISKAKAQPSLVMLAVNVIQRK